MLTKTHLLRSSLLTGLIPLILLLAGIMGFVFVSQAAPADCVAGPHSGVISADEQWCAVDSPHVLSADVTVPPTVTLTIESDVTVMGAGQTDLIIQGDLHSLGSPTQPITFTSIAGGGNQWGGLFFDGGTGELLHVIMLNGGDLNSSGTPSAIAIQNTPTGEVSLENCQILDTQNVFATEYGVYINNGRVSINSTTFSGNGNGGAAAPLYITGRDSLVTMTDNIITGNSRDRIVLAPDAMTGHDTTLSAQTVLQGYELESDYTVPPTVTLTLEPGVTVMGAGQTVLIVQGDLQAIGTVTQPITFTSVAGGGTQWGGLFFDGGTGDLRHVVTLYGGRPNGSSTNSAIAVQNTPAGEVSFENCQVLDTLDAYATEYGLYVNNGRVSINSTTFSGNGNGGGAAPLYIAGPDSAVTMTDNTFIGNLPRDRIILSDSAMTGSGTPLTPQTVPFELVSDFVVPITSTLTIQPGVVLKGAGHTEITIQGDLQALGTVEEPIIFASVTDSPGQWSGLVFDGGTGHLRHAILRNGGQSNSVVVSSNLAVHDTLIGEVYVENCQILDSSNFGVHVDNGQLSVEETTIGSSSHLLYVSGDSDVMVDGSSLEGATHHGVFVQGDEAWVKVANSAILSNGAFSGDGVHNSDEATVILSGEPDAGNYIAFNQQYGANQSGLTGQIFATYNYWGDPSGPSHSGNPGGTGESVSDRVVYEPWLTAIPTATLDLVQAVGPSYVSPGEITNVGIVFSNVMSETLEEVVIVLQLPQEMEFISSTGGGQYWSERHEVLWNLGDALPGDAFDAAVQVRFLWGLPPHHQMQTRALVAAKGHPNPRVTHEAHLNYDPLTVTSEVELSDGEVSAELAADPELADLFDAADTDGFEFVYALEQTMSDGSPRLDLLMINRDLPGELLSVQRVGDSRHIRRSTLDYVAIYDLSGGSRFDYISGAWSFWGDWTESGSTSRILSLSGEDTAMMSRNPSAPASCTLSEAACLRNCLAQQFPEEMATDNSSSACYQCYRCTGDSVTCRDICAECAVESWKKGKDAERLEDRCTYRCRDVLTRQEHQCTENFETCIPYEGWFNSGGYKYKFTCDTSTCRYDTSNPEVIWCPAGCQEGDRLLNPDQTCCESGGNRVCATGDECPPCTSESCNPFPIEAIVAHDPNALYGPQAATPGQSVEYVVEFENVGMGSAYGVFVEAFLPPELDANSLQISNGGVYYAFNRSIIWQIGEVEPGAGGRVSVTAQLPADVVSGTVLIASAKVHFPSVPEVTPTNDVITLVGNVVGYGQLVETTEGITVAITLSGYSPTANPLVYAITDAPVNGTLSGSVPNVTYTPDEDFEGADSFAFTVDDGLSISQPAYVSVIVNPGNDTEPPEIIATSPANGAMDVDAFVDPLFDNVYAPAIWAMFTEPLDASTVTSGSFTIEDRDGQLPVTVVYDGTSSRALMFLNAPLEIVRRYKVTLTTDVHDSAGNGLAEAYVWYFYTASHVLFIPLTLH